MAGRGAAPPKFVGDIGCDVFPNDMVVGDCMAPKFVGAAAPKMGVVWTGLNVLVGAGAEVGADSSISKRLLDFGAAGAGATAGV